MTENQNKPSKALHVLIGIALVISVLNLYVTSDLSNKFDVVTGGAVVDDQQPQAPSRVEGDLTDDDAVKGNKDAPITIVEFSDFECPFCARFYEQTLPQLTKEYIDTGKVKLVYRDFPLSFHANAQKAAEASECAHEQGKFWEMHDKLFGSGVVGGTTTFKLYAKDLGLDQAKFDNCLDSGKYVNEISKDLQDGSKYGVSGTPGFFVNGVPLIGAQPFEAFRAIIEEELKK